MKLKAYLFFLMPLLAAAHLYGQLTFPIDVHDGQTIETCSGFFVDSSGGDSLDYYQPGENYQLGFVSNEPENPYLKFTFDFFSLAPGDTLFVYNGVLREAQAFVEDELSGKTVYASTTTITFHFISHDPEEDNDDNGNGDDVNERLGWKAEISCVSLCELFTVEIDPLDGLMNCPDAGGTFRFSAQATYIPENYDYDPDNFVYNWQIEDAEFEGQQIEYDGFNTPGAYSVYVTATDPVTSCEVSTYVVFMVGTVPDFNGTFLSRDTVCAEEQFTLSGFANMTQWTGFQTAVVEEEPVFLSQNHQYMSSLTFEVFGDDVIDNVADIDRVCITIEHAEYRDVEFFLRAPNAEMIELKSLGGDEGPDVGFINLGEPVLEIDDIPGTGYEYCFAPDAWYGTMFDTSPQSHAYHDNAGNYYAFAYYMPVDGTYTPDEPFSELIGSPLNGTWELMIEHDQDKQTSGHVFGWRLMFNEQFYPDSLIFTPEIVEETWFQNGNALTGNPATTSVEQPGDHDFLFQVTDNFGCTYDTLLTIHVLPLPEIEIISELEIPICEGDSTLLTIHPINNDGYHYLYQWQVNGVDLPGSTYDTLMVKEPALYTVIVTDSITGCTAFFDLDVTDQNCDLTIPNVFTPNGDGINDEFEILNLEHYPNAQIVIFNRHGKRVFEHQDYYNNWWDGGNAPDGTYFYVLQYNRMGKTRYAEGSVTIIR